MANAYGLSPSDVTKAQGVVNDYRDRFTQQARQLFDNVETQMAGKWVGNSATAFRALHQAWQDKQRTIVQILNQFHDGLDDTKKGALEQETNAIDGVKAAERQLDAASHGHYHARLGS